MFSSMDGRKRHKHGGGYTKRDARAQDLVQRFIKDYQSFCGTNQSSPSTFPSIAHSYFSSLAMRALGGGGGAPPTPTPPSPGQHSDAHPLQSGDHRTPAGEQSVDHQQRFDVRPTLFPQESSLTTPGSLFQRKQQPVKITGVLEIYKEVMVALIELFDLTSSDQGDSMEAVTRASVNEETSEHSHLGTPMNTTTGDKASAATSLCGGATVETGRIQKRTLADQPKVVTRAESKRKLEVKKALVCFSKGLLSLEARPEQWKELQFLHVRWCRWDWW
jgi:hypothetical protein